MARKRVMLRPTVPGAVVRDPTSKLKLKETGEEKNLDSYWLRRLADGSVEIIDKQSTKEHNKPSTKELE